MDLDEVISIGLDTIDGYMDFSTFGDACMAEDGAVAAECGVVRRLSEPFPPEQAQGQQMMKF